MLKIAVCDDQPSDLKLTAALLQEYLKSKALKAEVQEFSHPDELLSVCEKEPFRLYILDIVMPMVDGISVGCTLRRFDREAQILYTTSEPGFALDAFSANPVDYLLKPIDRAKFFDALDFALSKCRRTEEETVTVKVKDGYRTMDVFHILCCEYSRHTAFYTLLSGEIVTTVSLSGNFAAQLEPLVKTGSFVQCHAAFAVNVALIEKLTRSEIFLRGGKTIPVSKSQYAAVRDAYLAYRLGGGVHV